MQISDQSMAVSLAAVRRTNHPILLVTLLPLLLAFAVAAAGWIYDQLSDHYLANRRIGAMTQRQAIAKATKLCAQITSGPAEAFNFVGYGSAVQPGMLPRYNEWQVLCLTASGRYFLRLDADSGEPIVIRREDLTPAGSAAPANGDYHGDISRREATAWARYYLRLAGLPLPDSAPTLRSGGYDLTYRVGASKKGEVRMLRVRVDPKDGSLVHLQNVLYHRFPPAANAGATMTGAATAPR